jgi:transposase
LVDHRNGGNRALLSPAQRVGIARKLRRYTPQDLFGADHQSAGTAVYWSVADLRRAVKQWTGVEYQDAQSYRTLFHDCGFSYQRTERQYRSRREADVIDFSEQIEKKLMDVARNAPETIILAEDEASVYLQATTQAVWVPQGQTPVIKVHPGRELTHFYGTLNLHTGEEVAQTSAVMNSEATAQHLQQVLDQYPATPLLLLWDRAPWHRGAAVRELLAANPRLEVLYFPTASPELYPQEHVWKTVRRAISHNHEETKLATLARRFEQQLNDSTFAYSFLEKYDFE